jgi:hypothetical protein
MQRVKVKGWGKADVTSAAIAAYLNHSAGSHPILLLTNYNIRSIPYHPRLISRRLNPAILK